MGEFILYEVDGAVATITINRPKALNALNSQVLDELDATLVELVEKVAFLQQFFQLDLKQRNNRHCMNELKLFDIQ